MVRLQDDFLRLRPNGKWAETAAVFDKRQPVVLWT